MRQAGHAVHVGDSRGAYTVLVGKPEWKSSLGTLRSKWKNNIKTDIK
jgi:hypothetical protein